MEMDNKRLAENTTGHGQKKAQIPLIVCRWCMTEISIGNVIGERGHENSNTHRKNKEKYEKNFEKQKRSIKRNPIF
jgi:hypothetical protein